MKALVFNDIHTDIAGAHRLVEMSRDADVVIAAGDFCAEHRGLESTIKVLGAIPRPSVIVPGNNETLAALREACAAYWPSAVILHGRGARVEGLDFFGVGGGIPTTPWGWSHDFTDDEASKMLEPMPEGAILVSHSPPQGHLDGSGDVHYGSWALLVAVEEKKPPFMFCGHIHEHFGEESVIGDTVIRNVGPRGALIEI
ncbi:metallophosphoesterase [bacterium]|nr:metallophosphoesterase [bacterium]